MVHALLGIPAVSIWSIGGARAAPQTARTNWIPNAALEVSIAAYMAQHGVPGLAIAVVHDGQLAWEGHYGVSNVQHGTPINKRTLFQAASLTKPVFAYGVMKLIEAGKLGLDSRLADYVLPPGVSRSDWTRAITVRHVLTHSTGLPNWRDDADIHSDMAPQFEPGTGYSYSGEAFHWLQMVVETITGVGIRDVLRRLVLEPAGLLDMEMMWTPERDAREVYGHGASDGGEPVASPNLARREHWPRLHAVAQQWGRPMISWSHKDFVEAHAVMRPHTMAPFASMSLQEWNLPSNVAISAASSLRTTVGDYARFMALMMDTPGGSKAWQLKPNSRKSMLTPQRPRPERPQLPPGLGWGVELRADGNLFHHWGKNGQAHISLALGDAQRRRSLVIMINGAGRPGGGGGALVEQVAVALTGVAYACI